MTHSYDPERGRTVYVESVQTHLAAMLEESAISNAIGYTASESLRVMTRNLYVPEISNDDIVSLPAEGLDSDAIPAAVLEDGKSVTCDRTFATFAPLQYLSAPEPFVRHFPALTNRVISEYTSNEFEAPIFGQDAAVKRMMYCLPQYPSENERTYFNMRPFVLLRFGMRIDRAARVLANALTRAEQIMNNPIVTVPDEEAFDAVNKKWRQQGARIEKAISAAASDT